jgi:anti-sigma factor RsiW
VSHLRDLIAALIDGELSHSERERALTHLAGCAACRAEVAAHRAIKERVASLATPPAPTGLIAELNRMAEPGEPLPATRREAVAATRPPTVPVNRRPSDRGASRPAGRRRHGRRLRTVLTAGTVVAAATLVTAFAVGGQPGSLDRPVAPDVTSYLVEHARTSSVVPFAELPTDAIGVSFRRGNR